MNIRLLVLRIFFPENLKQRALRELFEAAAEAFGDGAPEISDASSKLLLESFARFTANRCLQAASDSSNREQIRERLYRNTKCLGTSLRRLLKLKKFGDIMRASRLFYKLLGIDFQGSKNGNISITSCFFSSYYTTQSCTIMSAMDEGMAFGLTGGRILEFSQRNTEGQNSCKAQLLMERRL